MRGTILFETVIKTDHWWGLCIIHVNGDKITISKLLEKAENPAISPDGTKLAFDKPRLTSGGKEIINDIFVVKLTPKGKFASTPRRIVRIKNKEIHHIDWVGNSKIVFEAQPFLAPEKKPEIWIVDINGAGLKKLAEGEYPSGSPDGKKIIYVKREEGVDKLYIMDLKTGKQTFLTSGREPDWGPGNRIVYVSPGYLSQIMVVYANGTGFERLTGPGKNRFPAWSRNGKWILYSTTAWETGYDIAVIHVETGRIIRLTDWPGNEDVACFLYP